ncbi:hypothetical protein B566_EDAN002876, partial [Ephemera danica]
MDQFHIGLESLAAARTTQCQFAVRFYRVNYDTRNWQLLSESLLDLTHSTRSMLLDDALNLARGGRLDYVTALDVTELLPNETHLAPWSAALTGLGYLHDRLSND